MEMIFPYKEIKWNLTLVLAYDNVIQGTKKDFLIYRNVQDILLNAINGKDSSQQLKVICEVIWTYRSSWNSLLICFKIVQLFSWHASRGFVQHLFRTNLKKCCYQMLWN